MSTVTSLRLGQKEEETQKYYRTLLSSFIWWAQTVAHNDGYFLL